MYFPSAGIHFYKICALLQAVPVHVILNWQNQWFSGSE